VQSYVLQAGMSTVAMLRIALEATVLYCRALAGCHSRESARLVATLAASVRTHRVNVSMIVEVTLMCVRPYEQTNGTRKQWASLCFHISL